MERFERIRAGSGGFRARNSVRFLWDLTEFPWSFWDLGFGIVGDDLGF